MLRLRKKTPVHRNLITVCHQSDNWKFMSHCSLTLPIRLPNFFLSQLTTFDAYTSGWSMRNSSTRINQLWKLEFWFEMVKISHPDHTSKRVFSKKRWKFDLGLDQASRFLWITSYMSCMECSSWTKEYSSQWWSSHQMLVRYQRVVLRAQVVNPSWFCTRHPQEASSAHK